MPVKHRQNVVVAFLSCSYRMNARGVGWQRIAVWSLPEVAFDPSPRRFLDLSSSLEFIGKKTWSADVEKQKI